MSFNINTKLSGRDVHRIVSNIREFGGMFTDDARRNYCDQIDSYIREKEWMTVAEQDAIVMWSCWNKNHTTRAIERSGWDDAQDIEDFKAIVNTPVDKLNTAIKAYRALDTLAKDVFIDIIQGEMK